MFCTHYAQNFIFSDLRRRHYYPEFRDKKTEGRDVKQSGSKVREYTSDSVKNWTWFTLKLALK